MGCMLCANCLFIFVLKTLYRFDFTKHGPRFSYWFQGTNTMSFVHCKFQLSKSTEKYTECVTHTSLTSTQRVTILYFGIAAKPDSFFFN